LELASVMGTLVRILHGGTMRSRHDADELLRSVRDDSSMADSGRLRR
jgi:hypothetical protein